MRKNHLRCVALLTVLVGAGVLLPLSSQASAQAGYRRYHNARFGYSISYPVKILIPQGEAANGDGQKFLSSDGRTEMLVYGSHNVFDQTLQQVYQKELRRAEHPNRLVTYQVLRADWFVVSGIEDGRVFYQKTLLRGGVLKTFRIEYDERQKGTFDSITATISRSFRG